MSKEKENGGPAHILSNVAIRGKKMPEILFNIQENIIPKMSPLRLFDLFKIYIRIKAGITYQKDHNIMGWDIRDGPKIEKV